VEGLAREGKAEQLAGLTAECKSEAADSGARRRNAHDQPYSNGQPSARCLHDSASPVDCFGMCGRYRLKDPKKAFAWLEVVPSHDFLPRFNIAPTQQIAVVTAQGHLQPMGWGIVPPWAKATSKTLINARCESVREKPSFKSSFTQRRCLVPADGFYEWSRVGKRPHFFTLEQAAPFAIGAFWEPAGGLSRCCLLTTSANSLLEPIHDRMPVIVRREDWLEWLAPQPLTDQSFHRVTAPYIPDEMAAIEVSSIINSAKIDDARCCEPAGAEGAEVPRKLTVTRKVATAQDCQQTFAF